MEQMLNKWKDNLQKNRFMIAYGAAMFILFISLAGWALLPEQVYMTAESMGNDAIPKNRALLYNLGLTSFFMVLFTWKPRELVYFIALVMALLVSSIPLLNLVV